MDSQDFRDSILNKRPRYAKARIPLLEALANKGNKNSEFSQFGPIYEIYIYAFILGIKKGLKLELPPSNLTTDFNPIGQWKRDSKLVDFLLMVVFTRCEEIGFNWNDLEDMEDSELNSVIKNIISFIESYANGGLDFLQKEYENDRLENDQYMFVNLLVKNSEFIDPIETPDYTISINETTEEVLETTEKIINSGESKKIEFKSTLRVNLHTNSPDPKIELSCMKTIAGFLNTNGGTLLIGVSDDKRVLGLDKDFESFSKKDDLLDEFQKHLDNRFETYFGNSIFSKIKIYFPILNNKTICRIEVERSEKEPIYLKNAVNGKKEEFYIRRSASTISLTPSDMMKYIESHWN